MDIRLKFVGVEHGLLREERINCLTGEVSILWVCPECGYTEAEVMTEGGPRYPVVNQGSSPAPGPEDVAEFARLAETPAGRIELTARLAKYPRHTGAYRESSQLSAMAGVEVPPGSEPLELRLKSG